MMINENNDRWKYQLDISPLICSMQNDKFRVRTSSARPQNTASFWGFPGCLSGWRPLPGFRLWQRVSGQAGVGAHIADAFFDLLMQRSNVAQASSNANPLGMKTSKFGWFLMIARAEVPGLSVQQFLFLLHVCHGTCSTRDFSGLMGNGVNNMSVARYTGICAYTYVCICIYKII